MNKRDYKKNIDRSQAMVLLFELESSLNVLALALTEDNDILVQETLANLKSQVANLRDMLEERPLTVPKRSSPEGLARLHGVQGVGGFPYGTHAANPFARTEKDSWKWSLFISIWVDPSRKSGLIRS